MGESSLNALDRRQFLARMGVLGAAAVVADLPFASTASASPPPGLDPLLDAISTDTLSGLVAFVVPGPDRYSVAQGVSDPEPGGVDAQGASFMRHALDNFYPFPDELVTQVVQALVTGLTDAGPPLPLPPALGRLPVDLVRQLEEALAPLLSNDFTAPLSVLISLLLNTVATSVDPAALAGPFPGSPFANLRYEQKAEVFRVMEQETTRVAAMLDADLPEPARQSLSGLVAFVAGALLEFAAFGSYSEWGGLPAEGGIPSRAPVGWRRTGYLEATAFRPVEGWDDFVGYYEDRREVEG